MPPNKIMEAVSMNKIAKLPEDAIKRISQMEQELSTQGCQVVLVAYNKYADLTEQQIGMVQELEKKFKEQNKEVVLLAYNK